MSRSRSRERPAQPSSPLGDWGEPELEGLVAETIALHLARKERGKDERFPDKVWAFVGGVNRQLGPDEEPRLPAVFDKMKPRVCGLFKALEGIGVRLCGARCSAYSRSTGWKSVDLRVRLFGFGLRGHRAIVELKWSRSSVRAAKTACVAHLTHLRILAQRGEWRGPHPRCGKKVHVRYVGGLASSGRSWHFRLWKVPASPKWRLTKVSYGGAANRSGRLQFGAHAHGSAAKRGGGGRRKGRDDDGEAVGDVGGQAGVRPDRSGFFGPLPGLNGPECQACLLGTRRYKHTFEGRCRHTPGAPDVHGASALLSSDGETDDSGKEFSASESDSDSC